MSARRQQIHDFLWERSISTDGGMPSVEELDTAQGVLNYVSEFYVDPVVRRVLRLLNDEAEKLSPDYRPDPSPITFHDVGALLSCVTDMRQSIAAIVFGLDAVEGSRLDLSVAVAAGRVELEPAFDQNGRPRGRTKAANEVLEALGVR